MTHQEILKLADPIAAKTFSDFKGWSVLKSNGAFLRCRTQDAAHAVLLNSGQHVNVAHHDQYLLASVDGAATAVAWPQE